MHQENDDEDLADVACVMALRTSLRTVLLTLVVLEMIAAGYFK